MPLAIWPFNHVRCEVYSRRSTDRRLVSLFIVMSLSLVSLYGASAGALSHNQPLADDNTAYEGFTYGGDQDATQTKTSQPDLATPFEILDLPVRSLAGAVISLLDYIRAHVDSEPRDVILSRVPKYNRRQHFGGWINENPASNCLDTRNEVLVRDAAPGAAIVFKQGTCMVVSGRWHDPYTGTEFKQARSIQIDHVVPLKNAYASGAYDWNTSRRCHYANHLGNRFHLLAVSGHENMTKGEHGPDRYLPPDESYHCLYVHEWMLIKTIWKLKVTPSEKAAIERLLSERNCPLGTGEIEEANLEAEIEKANRPMQKCQDREREALSLGAEPLAPAA